MTKGLVNRIIPFSSVDGPGNRCAIFLQGCNFNCLYCHNPETISICNGCGSCVVTCPYSALSIYENRVVWDKSICQKCDECLKACNSNSSPKALYMDPLDVVNEIRKVKSFISGITVSGGECMLQVPFLTELFTEVKKMGLTTSTDTNGSISFFEQEELVNVMDSAMVDVKSYSPDEHKFLTGMDNSIVLENVKFLADINKLYEIRTVIVPNVLNNYYNVDMISKLITSLNPNVRYKLIKYRPIGVRTHLIKSYIPTDDIMNELSRLATNNGCKNVVLV
jgi:pyruvate formate lyase activating enzyme